jgi:hypothetical protein
MSEEPRALPQEPAAFKPCIVEYPDSGFRELVLRDCPTITGPTVAAELLLDMDRNVIGVRLPLDGAPKMARRVAMKEGGK